MIKKRGAPFKDYPRKHLRIWVRASHYFKLKRFIKIKIAEMEEKLKKNDNNIK